MGTGLSSNTPCSCTANFIMLAPVSSRPSPPPATGSLVQPEDTVITPDIGLGNWLYQRAQRTPHRKALTFEGTTSTYAQLQDPIDRLASALRANGICQADRVGFLGLNQPAFLETMFAAARLGAIFVPLNYRLTGPELSYIINNAGIHTLIADAPHRPVIDPIRDELPCRRFFSADHAGRGLAHHPGHDRGAHPIRSGTAVADDDTAIIMYTSGTTGHPKGAMLTHGNIWWNNINVLLAYDVRESDISLLIAPLFHIGGLNVNSIVIWQKGGHIVLHRTFDAARCLDDIARYRITTLFGVPAMLLFISQQPGFATADLSSLDIILCGGAPVPEPLMRLYAERGVPINQGYGMTESSPFITFLGPEWGMAKLGSAGRTPMFSEVRVVDADGRDVGAPHVNGEVIIRGPNVMKGYRTTPRQRERRLTARAGSTPATSAIWTTTDFYISPTGLRTWSSPAARTSIQPRSKAPSTIIQPSPRSRSLVFPTKMGRGSGRDRCA